MNYDQLLTRAHDALPDGPKDGSSRLSIPDPAGETDGAFTRFTNIAAIADAISREPDHIHRFVQKEFGTNGQFEGDRARYNGSFSIADFQGAIDAYTEEYVICSECGLPDTRLVREDGVDMLRCEACGAFRPVQKTADKTATHRPDVEEGATYEVEITGTGRKGDGVAHKGKYTMFVPGAQEGQTVRVQVTNISGDLAFTKLVS